MGIGNSGVSRHLVFIYGLMLVSTAVAVRCLCTAGATLLAPAPATGGAGAAGASIAPDALPHVLLALLTILVFSRLLGAVFRRLGQPAVIGEVIAGIALGPSLLGWVAPRVSAFLLPAGVVPFLGLLSQVGVIFFMFTVGLEVDTGMLRRRVHATIAVSHASIVAPFLLGVCLAFFLYPRLSTSNVPFSAFALFIGVAMSVSAFPVLARILIDRGLSKSRIGVVALACAAVDDITAWCLLALVVGLVKSENKGAILTIAPALAYVVLMLKSVRPLLSRVIRMLERTGRIGQDAMALLLALLLLSSLTTESIGIHALFGAFLLGAILPHHAQITRKLDHKLKDVVVVLLLPVFFALTGLRTSLTLVSGAEQWISCGLLIVVASLGKFGGSLLAARVTGMSWRDSAAVGILMNTRGLVELIVLNIGYDLGVVSPPLFAMLVIMALFTTAATTPILQFLLRGSEGTVEYPVAADAA
jgi:Kef-type K+ transport system membrane component KefB